jgi:large subunit ribosomal protein L4
MKADIFDINGKKTGSMELPRQLFGVRWSPDAVRQVVNAMSANQRQPVAHAKTRGEVAGSGIKPWRQKGTGNARSGSTRSPLWRKGGIILDPFLAIIRNHSQRKRNNSPLKWLFMNLLLGIEFRS